MIFVRIFRARYRYNIYAAYVNNYEAGGCSCINYSYSESDRLDEGSGGLDGVDWGADEVWMRDG